MLRYKFFYLILYFEAKTVFKTSYSFVADKSDFATKYSAIDNQVEDVFLFY